MLTRVVRTHVEVAEDQHMGFRTGERREFADGAIKGTVDPEQRVGEPLGQGRRVARMGWIDQMPALVARTVGLLEDEQKQIPCFLRQHLLGQLHLVFDAREQMRDKLLQLDSSSISRWQSQSFVPGRSVRSSPRRPRTCGASSAGKLRVGPSRP